MRYISKASRTFICWKQFPTIELIKHLDFICFSSFILYAFSRSLQFVSITLRWSNFFLLLSLMQFVVARHYWSGLVFLSAQNVFEMYIFGYTHTHIHYSMHWLHRTNEHHKIVADVFHLVDGETCNRQEDMSNERYGKYCQFNLMCLYSVLYAHANTYNSVDEWKQC